MKATGIIRRIDELGRVVIPSEIRRSQRLKEGDALELWTGADGAIILKKYDPRPGVVDAVDGLLDLLSDEDLAKTLPTEETAAVKAVLQLFKKELESD